MRYSFALLLLSLILFSCEEPDISTHANDFFNVEENNAVLPILVRGNTASGKIILFLQGGPGSAAIDFARIDYPGWKGTLEKDFAVAYFDYRGVGNKQGTYDLNTISYEQYTQDIHKILLFLKAKYNNSELFILGHSFGGYLAYHYMINYQSTTPAKAFISADGPITTDSEAIRWEFRRAYLSRVATTFVNTQKDPDYWTKALAWLQTAGAIDTDEEQLQWSQYAEKAEIETPYPVKTRDYLTVAFFSSYDIFSDLASMNDDKVSGRLFAEEKSKAFHIIDQLDRITLPVLFLTGQYDDVAPPEEIQVAYDRIGSSIKYYHVINDASHESFLNKPDEFRQQIADFINR